MKFNPIIRCFLVFLMLGSGIAKAQENSYFREHNISDDSLLLIARDIIKIAPGRTFITVDEINRPQARAMSPFPPEEDFSIWLGTSAESRKVNQIRNNPNVMMYYYEPEGKSYVSLAGKAELINDPVLKKKYWRDGWEGFYPDPEKYILIKVKPEHMEVCSFERNLFWNSEGKPAAVDF